MKIPYVLIAICILTLLTSTGAEAHDRVHFRQLEDVSELREVYQSVILSHNYYIAGTRGDKAWCVDYTLFVQRKFVEAGFIGINQHLVWTDSKVGGSLVRHDFVPHWGMTATTQDHVIWYFEADLRALPKMHRIYNSR